MVGYVRLNLLADLVAIVWLVAVRLWLVPSAWLYMITGILVGLALSLLGAELLLDRQRRVTAIVTVAVANWLTVIVVAAMVPFTLAIVPMIVLLPVLLAVPYMRRFQLNAMFGMAVGVIVAIAAGGRILGGVGLEARVPVEMLDAMAVVFVPGSVGLVLFVAWQGHLALAAKTASLRDSRVRLVTAADRERLRIERCLEESTRQRVAVAAARLHTARERLAYGEQPDHILEQMIKELQEASRELRDLGHGIFPPELATHGLVAALRTAVQSTPVRVALRASTTGRYPPAVEASVYFSCLHALAIVGECGDDLTDVTISLTDGNGLTFEISGGGRRCGTSDVALSGDRLTGVADRLGAVGGTITLHTTASGTVRVSGRIPRPYLSSPRLCGWRRRWDTSCDLLGRIWKLTSRLYGRIPAASVEREFVAAGIGGAMFFMAVSAVASLVTFVMLPHPWTLIVGAIDIALVMALSRARRKSREGFVGRALILTMVTTWLYAILLAVLVPVALHQTPLMILPVILAIPYVERRMFRVITAITIVVAVLITLASRFLPGVGVQEQTPDWLADIFMIIIIVFTTILALFVASLNHAALIHRAEALQGSRARLVAAADRERRRIERDLHDGAQQRLVAAAVEARVALRMLDTQSDRAATLLAQLAEELSAADTELRDLASGIYPSELVDFGIEKALRTAARRCSLPTVVHASNIGRFNSETEINVYFCCLEALQNAVKHAGAGANVTIVLRQRHGLVFEVRDTGHGCDSTTLEAGHGYANMHDRLSAIGGELAVHTQSGLGVQIRGHIARP